jgi:hypothetical protein
MKKIIKWWNAKTPIYARILQSVSAAISAIPLYYTSLPERFQLLIGDKVIMYISISGIVVTFLLNLLHKKENN